MDKNRIAAVLKATDGSVRKTAKTLNLDFDELRDFVSTEPDLAEVREFAKTRAAMIGADGNMDRAAHKLGITRQGLYHRINTSQALTAVLQEIRAAKKAKLGDVDKALDSIVVDDAEMALMAIQQRVSPRVVGRQWLIAKLQELTHRSERDIIAHAKTEPFKTKFEAKLPASNYKKFEASHVIFPVSLTDKQWEWMRGQKRGTAGVLIRKSKPIVGPLPEEPPLPRQTSYSISEEALFKLTRAGETLGVSAGAVFRHIINNAMNDRKHHKRAA